MLGAGSLIPMTVTRSPIGPACPGSETHPLPCQFQPAIGVDPLQTTWAERGTVSGRVALLPRSAEIQPPFVRFGDEHAAPASAGLPPTPPPPPSPNPPPFLPFPARADASTHACRGRPWAREVEETFLLRPRTQVL